uniref:SGNH hydrolase-type esterase domain-containing protein n=1 Tax=Magallana gigas TaxID=29159 RepID=A0A8W8KXW4_MAGGI
MPKVKKGQTEGTKGPKNKRKRTEKTRDMGTSSAQAESLSEEVPQMMAPVSLHGDAAPGAPGGLDAASIPDMCQISAIACLAHQDMALLKGLDKQDLNHSPPPDQLSNSQGLRCSVWIVGSSIVRNAGIAALSRPGGQGLGLQTKGIDIWWQGYGGLRFVDLACKLRWLAQFENPPNLIVIHCGANDIGQVKTQKLLDRVRWDLRLLASIFPNTKLVWSFLLPRVAWRYSKNVRVMEQTRNRVNRAAAKEILGCGGRLLRHTQFLGKPKQLYSRDGVHLSGLGNDIYLNNLQSK